MIEYVTGDLFAVRERYARAMIAHVCNNVGAWGAGFTKALSMHYPEAERAFRLWSDPRRAGWGIQPPGTVTGRYALGECQIAQVSSDTHVANLVAQVGIGQGTVRLDYAALGATLGYLAVAGHAEGATVLVPRLGCGLAGGSWAQVEPLLAQHLVDVRVVVCTREGERFNP